VLGHRVKLHNKLKEVALAAGATINLGRSAVEVNKHDATVKFDDGSIAHGDLIIGADGVHSVCRNEVSEEQHRPFGSGKSAFRFMIPRDEVLNDLQTHPYAKTDGEMIMAFGSDRRLVMYPTSNNTILNFVCIHPESETESTATGSWNNKATKGMLLDVFKDFHEDFKAILSKSNEESLKIWKLLDMVGNFDHPQKTANV
jgi:2-polyprenyl-6-methoxyphenol hydroxylase-like FAD-dependent oxidoreductase